MLSLSVLLATVIETAEGLPASLNFLGIPGVKVPLVFICLYLSVTPSNMKNTTKLLLAAAAVALGLTGVPQAQASVVIGGTRIIYGAKEKEVTLKISNPGTEPALTQVWIDKGDPSAAPASIEVPFTVSPPIARIDPGKGQMLRIIYTGEVLPQDRESVFYFNLLDVPPKPTGDAADLNKLQLAFRSRIKLFFRPEGLKGTLEDAVGQVRWRVTQSDGKPAIEATNPSAYHVTFASVEVTSGGKSAKSEEGDMLAPGETKVFPLTGQVPSGPDAKVHYRFINDYGGGNDGEALLGAAVSK